MTVAVVIPLYNKSRYIRRALESVLCQTYTDFEVIVVDDGSTDGSAELVRDYSDPRLRLLVQPNAGVSAARNRGVEEANAEWVAFLDADDEWYPTFLERVTDFVRATPSAVAVFTNFVSSEARRPYLSRLPAAETLQDYFAFCLANRGIGMTSSTVLIRRDTLQSSGGFPVGVTHGEDVDTWGRIAFQGGIGYLPEVLAVYHTDTPKSATKQVSCTNPLHPPFAATYWQWTEQGRVPARLCASSYRFVNWLFLERANALINAGDRAGARNVLRRHCQLLACPLATYYRILLRSLVAPGLLKGWRQLKAALRGLSRAGRLGGHRGQAWNSPLARVSLDSRREEGSL